MAFSRDVNNLIADLRGLPRDHSRSVLRGTTDLDSLLTIAMKQYRIDEERVEHTIMRHWRRIVGEKWAERCSPVRLRNNRLHIKAANSVVRNELQFRKREIVGELRQLPGCEDIRDVLLMQG